MVPNRFCANLASKYQLSHWPAARSVVKVATGRRNLGLDGLAALSARLDAGGCTLMSPAAASGSRTRSAQAQQSGQSSSTSFRPKPAAPEVATVP